MSGFVLRYSKFASGLAALALLVGIAVSAERLWAGGLTGADLAVRTIMTAPSPAPSINERYDVLPELWES